MCSVSRCKTLPRQRLMFDCTDCDVIPSKTQKKKSSGWSSAGSHTALSPAEELKGKNAGIWAKKCEIFEECYLPTESEKWFREKAAWNTHLTSTTLDKLKVYTPTQDADKVWTWEQHFWKNYKTLVGAYLVESISRQAGGKQYCIFFF